MFGISEKADIKKAIESLEKKKKLLENKIAHLEVKKELLSKEIDKNPAKKKVYDNLCYMLETMKKNIQECNLLLDDLYKILQKKNSR